MVRAVGEKSAASELAFARTAQGVADRLRKMAGARGFVPAFDDQATAQVHRPAQTQSLADLSYSLTAGREAERPDSVREPVQQSAPVQLRIGLLGVLVGHGRGARALGG